MKLNSFFKPLLFGFLVIFIASCDKDVNEIGADFVDNDHYAFLTQKYDVTAYNQDLRHPSQAVQTNNLPINQLGYYNNTVFGTSKANFVTQLELASANPTFINNPSTIQVDSVYLYVPYFTKITGTDSDNQNTYELDSVYGSGKIKLEVFRSNYYLRNLDPNPISGLLEQQNYFSDDTAIESQIIGSRLNNRTDAAGLYQNDNFEFSATPIKFYKTDPVTNALLDPLVERERLAPGIYMDLDAIAIKSAIIQGGTNLIDNNVFKNYFRGLFFRVTPHANNLNGAAMAQLNFAQGRIVIKYKDATSSSVSTIIRKTMTLNMKGYTANLLVNNNNGSAANSQYISTITNPSPTNGDSKLYLKGGAGSMAIIDLFGGQKNDNSSSLNQMRNEHWLINDANLVFNIDNDATTGMGANSLSLEPSRIYLYDFVNNKPLIDYYFDTSTYLNPKFNKLIHSGIIRKVSTDVRGTTYKIRITNHIRNLVKYGGSEVTKDSTNVKLGLVVTENINAVTSARLKNPFSYIQVNPVTGLPETKTAKYIPSMSVANPLGTVLYGSNASVPDNLRLQLEIVYTKPD